MGEDNLNILMVEDTEEDFMLVQHALKASGCPGLIFHVRDGAEAIAYLEAKPPFEDRQRWWFPNTMLIDLKMPKVDGFQLLEWLQQHPDCAVIPTVIYSSSYLDPDVTRAYQLGANAFLSKPNTLAEIVRDIKAMHTFWSLCRRPPPPDRGKCS